MVYMNTIVAVQLGMNFQCGWYIYSGACANNVKHTYNSASGHFDSVEFM